MVEKEKLEGIVWGKDKVSERKKRMMKIEECDKEKKNRYLVSSTSRARQKQAAGSQKSWLNCHLYIGSPIFS